MQTQGTKFAYSLGEKPIIVKDDGTLDNEAGVPDPKKVKFQEKVAKRRALAVEQQTQASA